MTVSKNSVLSNLSFFLDCGTSGLKNKKLLQTYVESHGGIVSMILNQKVDYYVFYGDFNELVKVDEKQQQQQIQNYEDGEKKDINLETLSFNIKKAIKLNVPIVSKRYLEDSISYGNLLPPDEYSLVSQYNIKEYHYQSLDFSNVLSTNDGSNGNGNNNKKLEMITYDPLNPSDKFPTESKYHIIKHNVLISTTQNSFICIELHVGGKILDLIKVGGSSSDENNSSSDDNEHSNSFYRVFLHRGQMNLKNASSSIKEWVSISNLEDALKTYNQIFIEYTVDNNYLKIQLGSMLIGSDKLQLLYNNNNTTSDNNNTGTTTGGENLKEMESISKLIKLLYDEAIYSLGSKFNSGKLSLTPEGSIKTPMGDISLIQVDKAELSLFQLSKLLRSTNPPCDIKSESSVSLINEIFKSLPQLKPTNGTIINYTYDLLSDIQDSIQLMKDILSVGESLSGISNSTTIEQSRYRALRCGIQLIDNSSKDYKRVIDQLKLPDEFKDTIKIKNLFKISRKEEENHVFSVSNVKSLYHGSNPSNLLGILSRGLLTPNISTSLGSGRRDIGFLGSGIYFGVKSMTSIEYCKPSSISMNKYMFICQVALGNIKKYTTHQTSLNEPPKGYNSVQGVGRSTTGTTVKQSDFKDDEIAIFDSKQQKIQYLLEFEDQSLHHTIPMPIPTTIANQLKIEISKDQLKPTITPDVVSSTVTESEKQLNDDDQQQDDNLEIGLISKNGSQVDIPLKSVHVRAKILDLIGEVTIYQRYQNNSSSMIEAKYVFPLDEMGAVCGFEAYVNGKHIIGECKEKEQAQREYREAVAAGHGAYLMDEDKPDVFTVSVGNLPPKCDVLIKIIYVTELSIDGLDISFILPRSITPKQRLTSGSNQTQSVTSTLQITEQHQLQSDLSIQVGIEMPYNIVKLVSPTHSIKTKQTHTKATIELNLQGGDVNRLDKNFQLLIGLEEPYSPRMWVEVDEKGHHASMLAFYPKLEIDSNRDNFTHVTFLIDLSASMAGDTFQDLLRTVRVAISNLRGIQKLLFNIVCFGDTFDWLFVEDVQPSESNLQIAWNHINNLRTSYGGTLLHQPLESIYLLAEKAKSINPHNVLLFTDGNVANEELIQMLAKKASSYCRLFAFGVGEHCSRHFIKSICRLGGGYSEFIVSNKRPNPKKVIQQIQRILQPAMSNISVAFDSTDKIIQSPATISSIFKKERQVIYAFSGICTRATLVCQAPGGGKITNVVHTPEIGFIKGNLIHRLAARSMIREYQDGTYSLKKHEHDLIKLKKKSDIIDLSISYSIVTPFTSFVAIEKRDSNTQFTSLPSLDTIINKVDSLPYIVWSDKSEGIDQNPNDPILLNKRDQLSQLIKQCQSTNKPNETITIFHQITDTFGQYNSSELSLLSDTIDQLILKKVNSFDKLSSSGSTGTPSKGYSTPSKLIRDKKKLKDDIIFESKGILRLLDTCTSVLLNSSGSDSSASIGLIQLLENQCVLYNALVHCDDNKYSKKQWTEKLEHSLSDGIQRSKSLLPPTHPTSLKISLLASNYYKSIGNYKKSIEISKSSFDNAISELDCLSEDSYSDTTLILQQIRDSTTETLYLIEDEEQEKLEIISTPIKKPTTTVLNNSSEPDEPVIESTVSTNQWVNISSAIKPSPIKNKPTIVNQSDLSNNNNNNNNLRGKSQSWDDNDDINESLDFPSLELRSDERRHERRPERKDDRRDEGRDVGYERRDRRRDDERERISGGRDGGRGGGRGGSMVGGAGSRGGDRDRDRERSRSIERNSWSYEPTEPSFPSYSPSSPSYSPSSPSYSPSYSPRSSISNETSKISFDTTSSKVRASSSVFRKTFATGLEDELKEMMSTTQEISSTISGHIGSVLNRNEQLSSLDQIQSYSLGGLSTSTTTSTPPIPTTNRPSRPLTLNRMSTVSLKNTSSPHDSLDQLLPPKPTLTVPTTTPVITPTTVATPVFTGMFKKSSKQESPVPPATVKEERAPSDVRYMSTRADEQPRSSRQSLSSSHSSSSSSSSPFANAMLSKKSPPPPAPSSSSFGGPPPPPPPPASFAFGGPPAPSSAPFGAPPLPASFTFGGPPPPPSFAFGRGSSFGAPSPAPAPQSQNVRSSFAYGFVAPPVQSSGAPASSPPKYLPKKQQSPAPPPPPPQQYQQQQIQQQMQQQQIQQQMQLQQLKQPQKSVSEGLSSLLGSIKNGVSLNKAAPAPEKRKEEKSSDADLMATLASCLYSRRAAMPSESDEEMDEDDDWEDEGGWSIDEKSVAPKSTNSMINGGKGGVYSSAPPPPSSSTSSYKPKEAIYEEEAEEEDMGFDLFGDYDEPITVATPVAPLSSSSSYSSASYARSMPEKKQEEREEDEDTNYLSLFDEEPELFGKAASASALRSYTKSIPEKEKKVEEEDGDMGFGLFDSEPVTFGLKEISRKRMTSKPISKPISTSDEFKSMSNEFNGLNWALQTESDSKKDGSGTLSKNAEKKKMKKKEKSSLSSSSSSSRLSTSISPSSSSSSSGKKSSSPKYNVFDVCSELLSILNSSTLPSNSRIALALGIPDHELSKFDRTFHYLASYKMLIHYFIYLFVKLLAPSSYDYDIILSKISNTLDISKITCYGVNEFVINSILNKSLYSSLFTLTL